MAEKVEVVIKIPKYYLEHPEHYSCLSECVRRGVVLPKGHGRLIDADAVKPIKAPIAPLIPEDSVHYEWVYIKSRIDNAPTILEEDRSEEE